jgi:hypothetical protein
VDVENLDLHGVAGFGALDGDWTGEWVETVPVEGVEDLRG